MRRAIVLLAMMSAAIAVHAQHVTVYQRGDRVRVNATPDQPTATALVLTIVAVPGDQIRLDPRTPAVLVNDIPVAGFSTEFIGRVAARGERIPAAVPEGHYVVLGEQRDGENITEYWGQHSRASLVRAQ